MIDSDASERAVTPEQICFFAQPGEERPPLCLAYCPDAVDELEDIRLLSTCDADGDTAPLQKEYWLLLRMKLSPQEAAMLLAFRCGLKVAHDKDNAPVPWSIHELSHLLFLMRLAKDGALPR